MHHDNMSVIYISPYSPLLYSKTEVCRGIPIFLIFAPNIHCGYSLEPPPGGGFNVYPQCMFGAKIRKNIKNFLLKFFTFYNSVYYMGLFS